MRLISLIKREVGDFNESFNTVKTVRKELNRVVCFMDYVISFAMLQLAASEYFEYEFYDKTWRARRKFVCGSYKKKFYHAMNNFKKNHIFSNKTEFLENYCDFIGGRDWLDMRTGTEEQFSAFCEKHTMFIAKPKNLSFGRGVHKEKVSDYGSIHEMYQVMKGKDYLLEEMIIQHPVMASLNPGSVNTVRCATVRINGKMRILGAAMKSGQGDLGVDNVKSGGIVAKVDPMTGIVVSDGVDKYRNRMMRHPVSGIMFHGFQIPNWDIVVDTLEKATSVNPDVRYTGWDVVVMADRVAFVEGNFCGDFDLLQYPGNKGLKADVEAILKEVRG